MENGKYTTEDYHEPAPYFTWMREVKWGLIIGLTLGLLSILVIELSGAPAPLPRRGPPRLPRTCHMKWPVGYSYHTVFAPGGYYTATGPVGHAEQWTWCGTWRLERGADGTVLHIMESREPHDPKKWQHFVIHLEGGLRAGCSPSGGAYTIRPD